MGHHLYQSKVGDVRLPSVRFVGGCRVHSTLSALLKLEPTTWSEAEWIAKEYDLNVASTAQGMMLYQYWFRTVSSLHVSDCLDMPDPMLYLAH